MDVSVEQLGMCTHEDCRKVFNMEKISSYEWVKRKCEWCGRPLTWKSLGMEPVSGANTYYRKKWIGPNGLWVNERPQDGFFIREGNWWVVPNISKEFKLDLPQGVTRQYTAWCQVWNRIIINDDEKRARRTEGYSLHNTLECLQRFVFAKKNEDIDMETAGSPYTCCIPPHQFKQITTPQEMHGMFYPIPNDLPKPYDRNILGEKVVQMIVAA
ncbi:MAG: hypothetical protein HYT27_00570 [Parcubacteria group bacterium]|nr:hypothetical protein [Parcubacteria group bacterium]